MYGICMLTIKFSQILHFHVLGSNTASYLTRVYIIYLTSYTTVRLHLNSAFGTACLITLGSTKIDRPAVEKPKCPEGPVGLLGVSSGASCLTTSLSLPTNFLLWTTSWYLRQSGYFLLTMTHLNAINFKKTSHLAYNQ